MAQRRGVIVASVALATLMNGLDTTITTIALPTILEDLHDTGLFAWVVTAFVAAAAAFGPAWGRLSDWMGRKRLLVAALVGFVVASMACGLAPSMLSLVLFRAVQGFFGGALFPLAYSVVADLYPPQERSKGVALINSVNAIAFAVGPILGAVITEHLGWRWNFYVNVPILIPALILILTNYKEERALTPPGRFDFPGIGLFALAIGAFVVGMGMAARQEGWTLALLAGAAALFGLFLIREAQVERPFIPLKYFTIGPFATCAACLFLSFAAFIGVMVFAPTYVQGVQGRSVQTMGLMQLSIVGGWFLTAVIGAKLIPVVGARLLAVVGLCIILGGLAIENSWTADSSGFLVVAALGLVGFGIGFTQPPLFVLGQTTLPPTDQGLASGLLGVSGNLGATACTAAFGTLLNINLHLHGGTWLADQVPHLMRAAEREALRTAVGLPVFETIVADTSESLHHVFLAELVPAALALALMTYGLYRWGRGKPVSSSNP